MYRQHAQEHLSRRISKALLWLTLTILVPGGIVVRAAKTLNIQDPDPEIDLIQLSLEELGSIRITTVSRKSEKLSGAAAAIYVITQEDIRRSGVTVLPEALRMAPGLEVARANSRQWAIGSRGFTDTYANKLLVLMDGRTLYTPLFSGVFWEETDAVLEDVDRIEVIRGPGATLWGANAVNGVINIITKSAKETQGVLVSGGGGTEERAFGTVRYGGRLGTNAWYRVYSKYGNHDEFTQLDGQGASDSWWSSQSGFRTDWEPSKENHLTLQGDYYYGELGGKILLHEGNTPGLFPFSGSAKVEGGNLLGRWTHDFSSDSELSVQLYYDRTDRDFFIGREVRDTFDLDIQHQFSFGERHEIVWGGGYRYSADDIAESQDFQMTDPNVGLQLASAYLQDEIAFKQDQVHLTLGARVEHNDFTGFEFQPTGRISWAPNDRNTLWGAVSRAVRTPSRTERDFRIFLDPPSFLPSLPVPVVVEGLGNREMIAEELLAFEIGYRAQFHDRFSIDWAVFYNDYQNHQSVNALPIEIRTASDPGQTPFLVLQNQFDNDAFGETYGFETSATWRPTDRLRLRANYTFLRMQLHTDGSIRSIEEDLEGNSPKHQVSLSSDLEISRNVELGLGARYVDALPGAFQRIPAYEELDARLAWRPAPNLELSIVGRGLLHAHHSEFSPLFIVARDVQIDRAVYGKLTWRF